MLKEHLDKLWRERKYLAVCMLTSAIVGAVLCVIIPPRYSSTARIIPPQQIQSSVSSILGQMGAVGFTGLMSLRNPADVYANLLRSDTVGIALATQYALDKHYGVDSIDEVLSKLDSNREVRTGKDGLVAIRVTDRDPVLAAKLSNGYVEELQKLVQKLAEEETEQRRRFINAKMKEAKSSLEATEVAFRKMQESAGAIDVGNQYENTFATIGGMRTSIIMREVALRTLANSSTPQHPAYRAIEAEIEALRVQMKKLEENPEVRNPKLVLPAGRGPGLATEYIRMLRQLKFEEAMYQAVFKQHELLRMEDTKDFQQFMIVDMARPAIKRNLPSQRMIFLISLIVGLTLAIYFIVTDNVWYVSDLWKPTRQTEPNA